jgi:hypothetical protein
MDFNHRRFALHLKHCGALPSSFSQHRPERHMEQNVTACSSNIALVASVRPHLSREKRTKSNWSSCLFPVATVMRKGGIDTLM